MFTISDSLIYDDLAEEAAIDLIPEYALENKDFESYITIEVPRNEPIFLSTPPDPKIRKAVPC